MGALCTPPPTSEPVVRHLPAQLSLEPHRVGPPPFKAVECKRQQSQKGGPEIAPERLREQQRRVQRGHSQDKKETESWADN